MRVRRTSHASFARMSIVFFACVASPTLAQPTAVTTPHELTIVDAVAKLSAGELKAVALVESLLVRIDRYEYLNAFINIDREGALAAAAAADSARERGTVQGPLAGIPLVVKDNINTANLPTTGGTPALETFEPAADAPVIQRLTAAGAIILGKTNMHELAFGITSANAHTGFVANAYSADHFAGGSSGGSGAAIAARLAPGGLGTDTGGSVRIPAALNGIAGLRPSIGRYPAAGIISLSATRDTAGPMARTVADLVLLDNAITGYDQPIAAADLGELRLGVPIDPFWTDLEPETRSLAERLLDQLRERGATIVEISLADLAEIEGKLASLTGYEIKRDLSRYLVEYDTGVDLQSLLSQIASPDVKGAMEATVFGADAPTAAMYRESMEVGRPALQAVYRAAFVEHELDALIFPTTVRPAGLLTEIDEIEHNGELLSSFPTYVRNTSPSSLAGLPGLSIPLGLTMDGLPVGLELDGPVLSDRNLLSIGLAIENLLGPLPPPNLRE